MEIILYVLLTLVIGGSLLIFSHWMKKRKVGGDPREFKNSRSPIVKYILVGLIFLVLISTAAIFVIGEMNFTIENMIHVLFLAAYSYLIWGGVLFLVIGIFLFIYKKFSGKQKST